MSSDDPYACDCYPNKCLIDNCLKLMCEIETIYEVVHLSIRFLFPERRRNSKPIKLEGCPSMD